MAPRPRGRDGRGSHGAVRPDQSDRVDDRPPRVARAALLARAGPGQDRGDRGEAVRLRQAARRAAARRGGGGAWGWWRAVTTAADPYLDRLAGSMLTRRWKRESSKETPGTKLHRTTYHNWFHLGESQAVRPML